MMKKMHSAIAAGFLALALVAGGFGAAIDGSFQEAGVEQSQANNNWPLKSINKAPLVTTSNNNWPL
ncbi:hypothetical protein ACQ3I4_12440 [Zafaria sp. Z1313]|uniref:hypothetical protein n=1 Tax=Zafaria sp. Z1313 TaxID=3423202 RepID=UPI003D3031C1